MKIKIQNLIKSGRVVALRRPDAAARCPYLRVFLALVVLAAQATVFGQLTVTNIAQECAASHSLFLKSDGSLWAMGDNTYGQLGDGFIVDNPSIPPYYDSTGTPEQIFPSPRPVLAQTLLSKTNLQFTATCGFGGNFYLLAGTNLSQPLSQWTPVYTNVIEFSFANVFSATLTNAVNSGPQHFYILQS